MRAQTRPVWVWVVVACALIATGGATRAEAECQRQVQVKGAQSREAAWLVKHLRTMGIAAWSNTTGPGDATWGCPEMIVELEARKGHLHLDARDARGNAYTRDVARYAIAATLIDSWLASNTEIPVPYLPSEWNASLRIEAGRDNGNGWGVGAAGGLNRRLGAVLRAQGNLRVVMGQLLVPVVDFNTLAVRAPVEEIDATIDLTAGASVFARAGEVEAGLGIAGGGRVVVSSVGALVPLAELTASLELPIAQRIAIELTMTAQLMAEYGPFKDGTWAALRGGVGVTWGLE